MIVRLLLLALLAHACIAASTLPTGLLPLGGPRAKSPPPYSPLLFHSTADNVFVARSAQFSVQVHAAGFVLSRPRLAEALTVDLVDASAARLAGEQRHGDAVVNYVRGSDASQWRSGVPVWQQVRAAAAYPGVDVVYYTSASGQLEFDFALQPGADHHRIGVRFAAAWSLSVDADGSLIASHAAWGSLTLPKPIIYQPLTNAQQQLVNGGYALADDNVVGFWLGDYDAELPLVIDPLVFSTFLGGSNSDVGHDVVVDAAGNMIVVGETESSDWPTTPGAYSTTLGGGRDAFVSVFNASGALVYSTYIGGLADDVANSVALDSAGNVVVGGWTESANFPTTSDALDTSFNGDLDVFVAKFSVSGALVYATFLGGSAGEVGNSIVVDSADNIAVTGFTESSGFSTTSNAFQSTYGGGTDAFLSIINASGALAYSTFIGGSNSDVGHSVATDSAGNFIIAGQTSSNNFPTTPGALDTTLNGPADVFVAIFNASGALALSTYIGGSGSDTGYGLAVDSADNIVVVGYTDSADYPTTSDAHNATLAGGQDVFVSKLNAAGTLVYSTFIGGSDNEYGFAAAVDSAGNIVVVGPTASSDFPVTAGAINPSYSGGGADVFVSKLNASGVLVYSTYIGGTDIDYGVGVALDSAGNMVIAGYSHSNDYPTTPNATIGGAYDAIVTKLFDCSALSDCSSHGTCTAPDTCTCDQGWTVQPDCSVFDCLSLNNCSSHGTCTGPDTCTCDQGWTASANCSIFECLSLNNCSSHGTCIGPDTCSCDAGWTASANCSIFECLSLNNCSSHGTCTGPDTCTCDQGWTASANCSIFECLSLNNCSSHGTCIGPDTCNCDAGWTASANCSVFDCLSLNNCSSHGTCTGPDTCTCDAGWTTALNCSVFECINLNDCSSHGTCTGPDTCSCNAGWAGSANCSVFECSALNDCSSHGTCTGPDTCSCDEGWTAASDCSQPTCHALANCSSHGDCVAPDTCECDNGWAASSDCGTFECFALNSCSAHGDCTGPNTCHCDSGWTAADCSVCPGLANSPSFANFHRRRQRRHH